MTTPPPKRAEGLSEKTNLNTIHLGLLLVMMIAGGTLLSHELSPIREDIKEIRTTVNDIQKNPVPKHIYDRFDALESRLDRIEGATK